MDEEKKNIEKHNNIDFIDFISVITHYKWFIIITTGVSAFSIVIFCILSIILPADKSPLPNKYTSTATVLISEQSVNSDITSVLNSSGLGSLAGMMGVSKSQSTTNKGLAEYLLYSSFVLDKLNEKFNFTNRYKIKNYPITDTRLAISKELKSNIEEDSGVFEISFTDVDPIFARDVVNYAVNLLDERFTNLKQDQNKVAKSNIKENINNTLETIEFLQNKIEDLENSVSYGYNASKIPSVIKDTQMLKLELDAQNEIYKQLKAQDELLNIEQASDSCVFQIIEYADIPDKKSGPARSKLCILVVTITFVLSILFSCLLYAIKNMKRKIGK